MFQSKQEVVFACHQKIKNTLGELVLKTEHSRISPIGPILVYDELLIQKNIMMNKVNKKYITSFTR